LDGKKLELKKKRGGKPPQKKKKEKRHDLTRWKSPHAQKKKDMGKSGSLVTVRGKSF